MGSGKNENNQRQNAHYEHVVKVLDCEFLKMTIRAEASGDKFVVRMIAETTIEK
jgi:hypothetical protein